MENASKSHSSSGMNVGLIKQIVAHGFESSQIINLVETFITKNKIPQPVEVEKLLDKYSVHYPFLELYKNKAIQATTVTDYVLSLPNNYDICVNIFHMLPKLWSNESRLEKFECQMGYYGCLSHIITCANLYNAHRHSNHGLQYLISNECYTFNPTELAVKLKQEETFVNLEMRGSEAFKSLEILKGNIKQFDVFNRKDGNLLSYIFYYIMNMNRLLYFKKITLATPEEILATDLFSLIGDIIFDNESVLTPGDIETVVSNLNTNILHVLTKNTCPDIDICRRFVEEPEKLLERLLSNLTNGNAGLGESQYKINERKVFKLERKDIVNYVMKRNVLVAYIMGQIHGLKPTNAEELETNLEFNVTFLKNLVVMLETRIKTEIYRNNATVSALNFDYFDVERLQRVIDDKRYE